MKKTLIEFYLDWVNNYLTVSKMAEHYNLSNDTVKHLIEAGKIEHEKEVIFQKYIA